MSLCYSLLTLSICFTISDCLSFSPKIRASYTTLELGGSVTVFFAIFKNRQISAVQVPILIKFDSKNSSSFHFPKNSQGLNILFFWIFVKTKTIAPKKLEIKRFEIFPKVSKCAKVIFYLYFHFVTVKKKSKNTIPPNATFL